MIMKQEMSEWKELAPGQYERAMGENEQFIAFIGSRAHPAGLEQWTVSVTARFKLTLSKDISQLELIQAAWQSLRQTHPSIACRTTTDGKLQYTEPDDAALAAWFQETFFIVKGQRVTPSDIIAALKPSPLSTLHYLESQNEIIISTAHWRTDGYGAMYLINEFFTGLATVMDKKTGAIEPTAPSSRLVPSLEWALKLSTDATDDTVAAARKYLATGASLGGTAGIVYDRAPTTRPRGTRHVELSLTKDETDVLSTKCSQLEVSVYSMVHAAVSAAVYAKAPPQDAKKHFTSTIRLNLRPQLASPFDQAAGASGLYTGGYLFPVAPEQSVLENARLYEKEYMHGVSDAFLSSRREYAKLALAHLRTITGPPPPISNVDVSFVRDVDDMITPKRESQSGSIEILDVGLGVNTLTRQLYCFYWIFKGALKMQLWYNEAFYHEGVASSVLEEIKSVLIIESGRSIVAS